MSTPARVDAFLSKRDFLFTSESVAEGHPDKVCDQISDAVVDAYLRVDPSARVAAETVAIPNKVMIAGEVRSRQKIERDYIEHAARECIKNIGYSQDNFHWQKNEMEIRLHNQSADIAMGVDGADGEAEGAGDQGLMFGYACTDTERLMPAPIFYAHKILRSIFGALRSGDIKGLGPDAKSQVTLLYSGGKPVKAESIVVSIQHLPDFTQEQVREIIRPYIVQVFPEAGWMCKEEKFYVNPTGRFVIGGPEGDTGLTGRKIIVDTYGGAAPHGGGAFSGKDPSKVDRSAAYAARYLAKNVVAAELAVRCTIQISYAIGVARPVSFYVNTHNTNKVDELKLEQYLQEIMDLSPAGIRKHLKLNAPIYQKSSVYGHFGRTPVPEEGTFTWEVLDLVDSLKRLF
jgi:S-adenosylmethionine synthetase